MINMSLIKLITISLLVIGLFAEPGYSIDLSMNFYNSFDDLSVSLAGENLDFDGSAILMPDSLKYSNGGQSNQPEGYYSYSIALNDNAIGSGAATNSGAFGWQTKVDLNSKGDGSRTFTLSKYNFVEDGILESSSSNPNTKIDQVIIANNAAYLQKATISQDCINSNGKGVTMEIKTADQSPTEPENAQDAPTKGFLTITGVSQDDTFVIISTNAQGDMNTQFGDRIRSVPSNFDAGNSVVGYSKTQMTNLEMVGQATGFPTQRLPPGDLKASIKEGTEGTPPEIVSIGEHYQQEMTSFRNRYPQSSNPLWYLIDQRACIPLYESENIYSPAYSGELFTMNMDFSVRRR